MTSYTAVIFFVLTPSIYGISALEFTDCGSKVGTFTKVEVSDCVTTSAACILKKNSNATISIDFELTSLDECTKVSAVVHGIVMGIEMPFNLPNADGCQNSGITCPISKGSNYEYVTTLPVLKSYPKFTWQQVAEHNNVNSAWVIHCNKVYDVTKWVDKHPGGREMLLLHAGRDITDTLQSYHPFSDLPAKIISKYEIGTLIGDPEFPIFAKDSGFYKECRQQIGEYFQKRKIDPKDGRPGLWRMCLVFLVAFLSYFIINGYYRLVYFMQLPMIFAGIIFGICQALPLLHVMHDSSHAEYTKDHRMWGFVGRLTLDWFAGANLSSWLNQHVVGHHIYTNVAGVDPHLPINFESDMRRIFDRQVLKPIYAWQHIYLPPLYGLLSIKSRLQDFTDTFMRQAKGSIRVNPLSSKSWTLLVFSKIFWLTYRILIPIYYLNVPLGMFWTTFAITELVTGWYLAFNFQVSHVSTVCEYTCSKENASTNIMGEWAILQVKSSVDYAHGSWFTTFMTGALNYQITHHLFPSVYQYHYPDIAPIIMEICKKYKIKYTVLPSFLDAFLGHLQHLKIMGVSGRAVSVHMG